MTILTRQLPPNQLRPNTYNPNRMGDDEFAELVAEVRHLGRLPKPVVARQNCDGFEIIDGEHGWRAAKEVGLNEITVEVVEADDFEAMRQTYKRNQHGTHNRIAEGRMFRQMMDQLKLSQRQLAKNIRVSEGTIRNSLIYAEAAEVRKRYAPDTVIEDIELLKLQQVRIFTKLPFTIGNWWIDSAANKSLVERFPGLMDLKFMRFHDLEQSGLLEFAKEPFSQGTFADRISQLTEWDQLERKWTVGGIERDQLRQYTKHFFSGTFYVRNQSLMENALESIIDADRSPPFLLSPEEFELCIQNCENESSSHGDFCNRLRLAVRQKGHHLPENNDEVHCHLLKLELESAPQWLQEQDHLNVDDKYDIFTESLGKDDVTDVVVRGIVEAADFHTTRGESASSAVLRLVRAQERALLYQQQLEEKSKCQATVNELTDSILSRFYEDPAEEPSRDLRRKLATFTYPELLFLDMVVDRHMAQRAELAKLRALLTPACR